MAERVEVYKAEDGDWWWRHVVKNENVTSDSGEGYENRLEAIGMAKKENEGLPVFVIDVQEKAAE